MDLYSEVKRYLGYRGEVDIATQDLIDKKIKQMSELTARRFVYQAYEIDSIEDDQITLKNCSLSFKSKSLARHLRNSTKLYLMAASLGQNADRKIQSDTLVSPTEGLVSDAVGSALIEFVCDNCENQIRSELSSDHFLTTRFSPGYGDLSLDCHPAILKLLQAHKIIGLTSNNSHLLIPMKSVVAIIGVQNKSSSENELSGCSNRSCDTCTLKEDCLIKLK